MRSPSAIYTFVWNVDFCWAPFYQSITCLVALILVPDIAEQVQGEAQGGKDQLEMFLERLQQGPSDARVDSVETSDLQEQKTEDEFLEK